MDVLKIFELIKKNIKAALFLEEEPASIYVRSDNVLEVMRFLRESEETSFDALMNHTGFHETEDVKLFWSPLLSDQKTEIKEEIRLFWNLYSYVHRHRLTIETSVTLEHPEVDSITPVWRAANWLEREVYDLLGVIYINHPDLRRIMLPDDWEGYPLRKDYSSPPTYQNINNAPSLISQSFQTKIK